MHKITRNSLSFVATSGLLATALFILPLKADVRDPIGFATAAAAGNGGDHGGMRDEVQENSNTAIPATPPIPRPRSRPANPAMAGRAPTRRTSAAIASASQNRAA